MCSRDSDSREAKSREAKSRDSEARQFRTRHQFERLAEMASCKCVQRRSKTDEVAERAGKDHQHALRSRDML